MHNSRLIKLLASNRNAGGAVLIEAKASEATVYLYDAIVDTSVEAELFGGTAAQDLVPKLAALDVSTIHLRINSPGGSAFGGQAIAQALREHKANVIAHIDGIAASAATIVANAADESTISPGGMYMIHRAWTITIGNAIEMRSLADVLDQLDKTIAAQYASKTGMAESKIIALMDEETWMTAAMAVEHGFVDSVASSSTQETEAKALVNWDVSALKSEKPKVDEQEQEHRQRVARARANLPERIGTA